MKTACRFTSLISPYIDGELTGTDAERVRVHLDTCALCRSHYNRMSFLNRQMAAMRPVAPSPGFDVELWRNIEAMDHRRWRSARRPRLSWDFLRGWRPVLATAFGLLIVCGTLLFTMKPKEAGLSVDEIQMAQHMELLADYEIIDLLDLLENWNEITGEGEPNHA